MKGIAIRHMHRDHISEIIEIERSSFSTPWSEFSFLNEIYNPLSSSYVAMLGTAVVGYIVIKRVGDEGHILNLAVHPSFRRQGIARALAARGIEELRQKKCKYVYLEVRSSNYPARKLYEGFGFKVAGIRKSYYIQPMEDALIMVLKFANSLL